MVTYTIRKNEWGEYHVKFRVNGERKPEWDYFTDDKQDAISTAKVIERMNEKE